MPRCWNIAAELRDELLNGEIFYSLKEAKAVIGQWRSHYNAVRPHRGIDLEVPVPWRRARSRFTDATRVRRVDRLSGLVHEYSIAA